MIRVHLFGALRLDLKRSEMDIEAGSIKELMDGVALECKIPAQRLQDCLVFVNGVDMASLQGMRTRLKGGDEVQFFSPVCGG